MGYTHYWTKTRTINDTEWDAITAAAKRIVSLARNRYMINLAWEFDQPSRGVQIDSEAIRFNGIDEDGHETFYLSREASEFDFCKTARKDYDPVVVAVLQAAAVYCDAFSWRSDGDRDEHADGVKLYNEATGAGWDYSNVSSRD